MLNLRINSNGNTKADLRAQHYEMQKRLNDLRDAIDSYDGLNGRNYQTVADPHGKREQDVERLREVHKACGTINAFIYDANIAVMEGGE